MCLGKNDMNGMKKIPSECMDSVKPAIALNPTPEYCALTCRKVHSEGFAGTTMGEYGRSKERLHND